MGGYEYLEHKADLKIRAFGKDIEDAFRQAALGAFNFLIDTKNVQSVEHREIKAESKDMESLLYDFIEELLFLLDTEGFLLHDISGIKIKKTRKGYSVKAEAEGDLAEHGYETKGDIKSSTYSDMEIKQEEGYSEVIFVLDL